MATEKRNYKRVMLKLSGESLANDKGFGIDPEVVYRLAGEIKEACETGIEVAVVVGGGNIWRGLKGGSKTTQSACTPSRTSISKNSQASMWYFAAVSGFKSLL